MGYNPYSFEIPDILEDPLSDSFWNFLTQTARRNTLLYRQIFHCSPDDIYHKTHHSKQAKKFEIRKELYEEHRGEFRGHVVEFPLNYLCEENLNRRIATMERFMPLDIFT